MLTSAVAKNVAFLTLCWCLFLQINGGILPTMGRYFCTLVMRVILHHSGTTLGSCLKSHRNLEHSSCL